MDESINTKNWMFNYGLSHQQFTALLDKLDAQISAE